MAISGGPHRCRRRRQLGSRSQGDVERRPRRWSAARTTTTASGTAVSSVAGVPPPLDPPDVYAADRPNQLSPNVRGFRSLVYADKHDSQ
jgi:hypothetical protein